jgi:hypothetical protein
MLCNWNIQQFGVVKHNRFRESALLGRAWYLAVKLFVVVCGALGPTATAAELQRPVRSASVGVEVNVPTNGCTKKEDFQIVSNENEALVLRRTKIDMCKGLFPEGTWITFTKGELGGKNVRQAKVIE